MDGAAIAVLWVVSGWAGWLFTGYRWGCLDEWEYWLFLPVHASIIGPVMWLMPLIQE